MFKILKNKYYINTNTISYVEIGKQKVINKDEINKFNKLFQDTIIELFGTDWRHNVRVVVDSYGVMLNYWEANNSIPVYKEKYFQYIKDKVLEHLNIEAPKHKYAAEYIIHFIGGETISDTFSDNDLQELGIDIKINELYPDEFINTFLNFE